MNREQSIVNAKSLRKGYKVASIGVDKHGRRHIVNVVEHDSINLAKKDNGIGNVSLRSEEKLPPLKNDLPVIEEPEALAA